MAEIRFLADEHVNLSSVEGLRHKGVNIKSVLEINLRGVSDKDILNFASKEKLCIVTRDKDFTRLCKQTSHCGIIFMTKRLETGEIIQEVIKVSVSYKPQDLENAIIYIPLK